MASRSPSRAVAGLVLCGLGMIGAAGAALLRFPLLATYKIRILTLEAQVSGDPGLGLALVLTIVLAFGCYAAGFVVLRGHGVERGRPLLLAVVLTPPLICAAMLLFTHPTTSLDLYDYLYRGHMAARYGANNFVQTPEDLRGLDRLYWYTAWRRAPTAYGPLWELLSVGVARLAGPGLLGLVLGFKVASLLGWLLTTGAIVLASRPGDRLLSLFLWLWNPLVLWELVGAAHNDGWMLACVLLAVACLGRWPRFALVLVTVGSLLKYSAVLLWPVLFAAALAQTPGSSRRLALALGAGLGSATLVVLAYAPWWVGADTLAQLHGRRELFTSTPLAVLQALLRKQMAKEQLVAIINQSAMALLTCGVLVASWFAGRRPGAVAPICAGLLLWFLTAGTPWLQPWYLAWPISLLAIRQQHASHATRPLAPGSTGRPVRLLWALGAMSLGALLSYPAFAALRPQLDWPAKEAPWQTLIVALIYGPPLLTLALLWRSGQQQRRLVKALHPQEVA